MLFFCSSVRADVQAAGEVEMGEGEIICAEADSYMVFWWLSSVFQISVRVLNMNELYFVFAIDTRPTKISVENIARKRWRVIFRRNQTARGDRKSERPTAGKRSIYNRSTLRPTSRYNRV